MNSRELERETYSWGPVPQSNLHANTPDWSWFYINVHGSMYLHDSNHHWPGMVLSTCQMVLSFDLRALIDYWSVRALKQK